MPSSETVWPKNETDFWKRQHFSGLSLSPAIRSLSNNVYNRSRCASGVAEYAIMSSKYDRHMLRFKPDMTRSMRRWKVAPALHSPNGIALNRNYPLWQMKAVLSISSSATWTWWYEDLKLNVENRFASAIASKQTSIRAIFVVKDKRLSW